MRKIIKMIYILIENTIIVILVFFLKFLLILIFNFLLGTGYSIIFAPSPCGYGFASALYKSRVNFMRENLEINIPQNDVKILKFECSGFQDPYIDMQFLLTKQQTNTLINDFKKTYAKPLKEMKENTSVIHQYDCWYQENINFSDDASRPTKESKYYDFLEISINRDKDKNDFCILNIRLSTM